MYRHSNQRLNGNNMTFGYAYRRGCIEMVSIAAITPSGVDAVSDRASTYTRATPMAIATVVSRNSLNSVGLILWTAAER